MNYFSATRRILAGTLALGLCLARADLALGAEFTHNFTYNGTAFTNWVFCDDGIPAGQIQGALVAFDYGGGDQAYTLPIWRNFARDRKLALVRFISQDNFGGSSVPANTTDGMTVLNNTLSAAATGLGRSELSSSNLPLIFVGISRGGTSGAINFGWAYGQNRTVACIAYHGNSFNYLASMTSQAAKNIPVLYTIAQNDSGLFRQTDIETAVRTNSVVANLGASYGVRPNKGLFWTTAMQYGSSHASLGDDTYPLMWLGKVWSARFNSGTPGTLNTLGSNGSVSASYTLTNGGTTNATFTALSTNATFTLKDANLWLPSSGASEWLAENAAPLANTAYNLDSAQGIVITAPDRLTNRNFTGSGSLAFSGNGLVQLDTGASGNATSFNMTAGTIFVRNGATLRNGGYQNGVWTSNKAALDVDTSSVFDIWDGNAVQVDALTGAGLVTIGKNPGTNWAGARTLTVGANNGNGTFSGTIAGSPASDGGTLALIKTGSGNQTLTGANSFAGGTNVNQGRLIVSGNGTLGSGNLTVGNGATCALANLSGAVSDNATVTIAATGKVDLTTGLTERVAALTINGTVMAKGFWNAVRDPVHFSGTGQLWVGTPGASALQDWRQANFGSMSDSGTSANSADQDGDGLSNLMEFATGAGPASPTTPASLYTLTTGGPSMEFTYPRNRAAEADGATFLVEWSDTLGNDWSTAGVTQAAVPGTDTGLTTTWKALVPNGSGTRRFVRLRVVMP